MIWLFERRDETLEVIGDYSETTQAFEITQRLIDGGLTKESFQTEAAFRTRLGDIQRELEINAWRSNGPRLIAGAWKI